MKKLKWLKNIVAVVLLFATSVAHAALGDQEQILLNQNSGINGGDSVAVSGDWGFVGDSHDACSVYAYQYDALTNKWGNYDGLDFTGNFTADVAKQEITIGNCQNSPGRLFGASISATNGLLVIGASEAKDTGPGTPNEQDYGKIYFYHFDTTTDLWVGVNQGTGYRAIDSDGNDDVQQDAHFGATVSVRRPTSGASTATVLVGAPDYDTANTDAGKLYRYTWDDTAKTLTLKDSVTGEAAGDHFGTAVTSNGIDYVVSAPDADGGSGAVYIYHEATLGNPITIKQKISSGNGVEILPTDENLGVSVSISGYAAGSIILLGGKDAYVLEHNTTTGDYNQIFKLTGTNYGDVTQGGGLAGFGYEGNSVQVYYDNHAIDGTPDWTHLNDHSNAEYGRDISIGGHRILVNGNGTGTDVGTTDVAYSYYPAVCGTGGTLVANEWKVIGQQCDVTTDGTTPASISAMFGGTGDGKLGTYGVDWGMYSREAPNYDGRSSTYVFMSATDTMQVGVGYWIMWLGTGGGDGTYKVNDTLTGVAPTKKADPFARPDVSAVSVVDLKGIMTAKGDPTGRDGSTGADMRVLLSNPLLTPSEFAQASFSQNDAADVLVANAGPIFEGNVTVVYTYDPVADGWVAVSGTPGLTDSIDPGEGFNIKFSQGMQTELLDATNANVNFQLAEKK